MSRNVFEDYMDLTGYLPVLKHPFPGGSDFGILKEGGRYMSEAEVRASMKRRFGDVGNKLAGRHFDSRYPKNVVNMQVWGTTVTKTGVVKNQFPSVPPITNSGGDVVEYSGESIPEMKAPQIMDNGPLVGYGANSTSAQMGKPKLSAAGVGIGAMLVVLAIAVMFLRGGNK